MPFELQIGIHIIYSNFNTDRKKNKNTTDNKWTTTQPKWTLKLHSRHPTMAESERKKNNYSSFVQLIQFPKIELK